MAKEVFMPKTGMDMQEGTIIKWMADVGDSVKAGDVLLSIETDKVAMDVESPCDGELLCKYFQDGSTVPVATIIGYVGLHGEKVPDTPKKAGGEALAAEEAMLARRKDVSERHFSFQVAVIGGGPAGYIAALRAARNGARTVLFEKNKLGGTCTNVGCIPMKTYIRTAQLLDNIRDGEERGIHFDQTTLHMDLSELYDYKQNVVSKMGRGIDGLLKDAGVEYVHEEARLLSSHTIQSGQKTYSCENIILCGGSVSGKLPIEGIDQKGILTSEGMLELREVPKRLVIVGGGVIGCEMATAFSRFGSEVIIVELQDHLLPTFDEEVSETIERLFKEYGIEVQTGKKIVRFTSSKDHPVICLHDGTEIPADVILMSVGRKPNLSCLGVLNSEIDFERGKIMVDEYCRTNIPNIYACGDLTNRSILAHSAMKMGEAAAMNACGKEKKINMNRAPLCLYTLPEAAGIGLTEAQARKRGDIMIGRFPFSANGRAVSSGETDGFVKVIADKGYGEILGVHIVGANATEMIVEAKTMMDMEITVYEVADIMYPHPTFSEAFIEACADAIGECLNLPVKR